MTYTLKLYDYEDATAQDRREAEERFREVLDTTLGDASLVVPVYSAYLRIVATYGETPDTELLEEAEREIVEQWQAAHTAAVTAAFGPYRHMGEPQFEIVI